MTGPFLFVDVGGFGIIMPIHQLKLKIFYTNYLILDPKYYNVITQVDNYKLHIVGIFNIPNWNIILEM